MQPIIPRLPLFVFLALAVLSGCTYSPTPLMVDEHLFSSGSPASAPPAETNPAPAAVPEPAPADLAK
jgi:hypothetical protein